MIAQDDRPEAIDEDGSVEYRRRAGYPLTIDESDDDFIELEVVVALTEPDDDRPGPGR
jgi:hypothetical protein